MVETPDARFIQSSESFKGAKASGQIMTREIKPAKVVKRLAIGGINLCGSFNDRSAASD